MKLETDSLTDVETLVERFAQIGHERLEDLPIYNSNLHVEAVDFQNCQHGLLGALITPWFINIMLLPCEVVKWEHDELGKKQSFEFDAREHEFVLGEDEVVGRYFFRSVISPPHCYQQQAPARQEASTALQQLLGRDDESQAKVTQQVDFKPILPEQQGRREFMSKLFNRSVKNPQ